MHFEGAASTALPTRATPCRIPRAASPRTLLGALDIHSAKQIFKKRMDLCVIAILRFLLNKVEPELTDLRGEITKKVPLKVTEC